MMIFELSDENRELPDNWEDPTKKLDPLLMPED